MRWRTLVSLVRRIVNIARTPLGAHHDAGEQSESEQCFRTLAFCSLNYVALSATTGIAPASPAPEGTESFTTGGVMEQVFQESAGECSRLHCPFRASGALPLG